jgi:ribosome-associated protein
MSKTQSFTIRGEFIELIQLLKAINLAESGGQAKAFVEEGLVKLNGQVELRKRAKLRPGDRVAFQNTIIVME